MRPDRDDYITLLSGAPKACQDFNYNKHDAGLVLTYGIGYDYCSVMHYGQFDSDCIMTPKHAVSCTVKGQTVTEIGQRIGLSEKDIQEINKRYNCDGRYISGTYIYQINTPPLHVPYHMIFLAKYDFFNRVNARAMHRFRLWLYAV